MSTATRDAAHGVSLLLRGVRLVAVSPRLMALGVIPPLAVSVVLVVAVMAAGFHAGSVAEALTPFVEEAVGWVRDGLRLVIAVLFVLLVAGVGVMAWATITLVVGAPIHERISRSVDPVAGESSDRGLMASLGSSLLLVVLSAVVGLVALLLGLIPAAGPILAAIVGVLGGSWLLGLELLEGPLDRRGSGALDARQRYGRQRPWLLWGFAVPVHLCLLVPLLGVIIFPGAVAAATLLAAEFEHPGEPAPDVDAH